MKKVKQFKGDVYRLRHNMWNFMFQYFYDLWENGVQFVGDHVMYKDMKLSKFMKVWETPNDIPRLYNRWKAFFKNMVTDY